MSSGSRLPGRLEEQEYSWKVGEWLQECNLREEKGLKGIESSSLNIPVLIGNYAGWVFFEHDWA
jgi:hypothetical protein